MNDTERQAHAYADHGWHVLSLQPDSKIPFERSHGLDDATTRHNQIEQWWRGQPAANVGIRTGEPFGPTVLDVDCGNGKPGHKSLGRAIRAELVPPAQAEIRTPSGGSHLYFRGDSQPSRVNERTGLDLRSRGGYVVAPGSTVNGKPYVVVHKQASAATVDYQAIADHLEPERTRERQPWSPPEGTQGVGHLAAWVGGLQEGNRDAGTFWAACRAAEAGDREALDGIARAAESTGLTSREIAATIRSAQRTVSGERSPKALAQREAG